MRTVHLRSLTPTRVVAAAYRLHAVNAFGWALTPAAVLAASSLAAGASPAVVAAEAATAGLVGLAGYAAGLACGLGRDE